MQIKAARIPKAGNLNINFGFYKIIVIFPGGADTRDSGQIGHIFVASGQPEEKALQEALTPADGELSVSVILAGKRSRIGRSTRTRHAEGRSVERGVGQAEVKNRRNVGALARVVLAKLNPNRTAGRQFAGKKIARTKIRLFERLVSIRLIDKLPPARAAEANR